MLYLIARVKQDAQNYLSYKYNILVFQKTNFKKRSDAIAF
jgi:hypothetical protein